MQLSIKKTSLFMKGFAAIPTIQEKVWKFTSKSTIIDAAEASGKRKQ